MASGIVQTIDPTRRGPLDQPRGPQLDALVDSFIGTPYAETTAILTVMAALVNDDGTRARIADELGRRTHPMPGWLEGLRDARADSDVWRLTHVLGDGDDYLVGAVLPSGHCLSALVYVDHNLGGVVKDAFVVGAELEDLAIKVGTLADDRDQQLTRTDPSVARAVVEEGITSGGRFHPPLTSDTWPLCRPLVEWMVSLLPEGGAVPEPPEWTESDTRRLGEEFFASDLGRPVDSDDARDLLRSIVWFSTDYAGGDPLRWSPVTVEMLLADWFPRKVMADAAYLSGLPVLLRAYVPWCHRRGGIRPDLTVETLAAVEQWTPDFLAQVTRRRAGIPDELRELLDDAQELGELGDRDWMLQWLAREVGGLDALMSLDLEPLPDEPFDWTGIGNDVRPVVAEILRSCDACADEVLDVEHRTAMRRFLARAARRDPGVFARKGSPVRGAAAVAWVICTGNRSAGTWSLDLPTKELLAHFGLKGSVSDRVATLSKAAGLTPGHRTSVDGLGDPSLLVSAHRRRLAERRDKAMED